MSGPAQVRVKRKRDEPAPDALIVEQHAQKRAFTEQLHYVRKIEAAAAVASVAFSEESIARRQQSLDRDGKAQSRPPSRSGKRVFHLTRPREGEGVKKAKAKDDALATFEEARGAKRAEHHEFDPSQRASKVAAASRPENKPLKRPGKGSAIRVGQASTQSEQASATKSDRKQIEAVADQLHLFALAEVERPKVVVTPRFAGRRQQLEPKIPTAKVTTAGDELIKDDDDDFVYDTYVLAANGAAEGLAAIPTEGIANIGYLVITDEDELLWQEYLDDDNSEKEFDTDDEDENAEDYYGADYPEDELASDDEYSRNAYGYRGNGASDDEEWDEDTGAYSDDEKPGRLLEQWRVKD